MVYIVICFYLYAILQIQFKIAITWSYYIQPMNPIILTEEETKTIKYINNGKQNTSEKDEHSESATEKLYQQVLSSENASSKPQKHQPERVIVSRKVSPGEGQQKNKDQSRLSGRPQYCGHHKGKSLDLQQLVINVKKQKKGNSQQQICKQKYKKYSSNQINGGFRDRNTISQMKHYNHQSKKLNNIKHNSQNHQKIIKKKKPKTINQENYKQMQKDLRKHINEIPTNLKSKKRNSGKLTHRSIHSCRLNNQKNMKKFSKSEEILVASDYKQGRKHNIEQKFSFQRESFSMPITQRIISLFSNTSSVFNSRKDLEVFKVDKPFIIPTQESVEQIYQIREYENVTLKKKNSDSLRRLKKLSPFKEAEIVQINQQSNSTLNIVKLYLHKFKEIRQQSLSRQLSCLSKQLQQISYIPEITKQRSNNNQSQMIMSDSLNLAQIQNDFQGHQIIMQSSDVVPLPQTESVLKQQQQIGKLDGLIQQLQSFKLSNLRESEKNLFITKIRELMQSKQLESNDKIVEVQKVEVKQIKANNSELTQSYSQLKQSIKSEQVVSQLNLEVLDKALREREAYLMERKERELQRFQEQNDSKENKSEEIANIIKWIDYQIKEVSQTRHQLWKSFYFANNILKDPKVENSNQKKKKMMKCLSDKYINRNKNGPVSPKQKKKKDQVCKSKQSKRLQLSDGRINQSPYKKQKCVQSVQSDSDDIDIQDPSEKSEQLLTNSWNRKQPIFNEFLEEKKEQLLKNQEEKAQNTNNVLIRKEKQSKLPTKLETLSLGSVQQPQSIGLNLLQIECDVQEQESYSAEQLAIAAKQSVITKNNSSKFPLNLNVQDKQDIFEFIFLDLCIQLTDQYKNDSPLMLKIYTFIRNMQEQSKKQKGFKTNTNALKDYLFQLISFLKAKNELLLEVHSNIDKPLGPTALDILKYMHVYEQQVAQEESNDTVFILDSKIFQLFENIYLPKLEFQTYYLDEDKEKKRRVFLKNAIHIHNKAIFDALNEHLDRERPFGVWGEPFSWKKQAKFYHHRTPLTKNNLILKCAQKTIECGAYMCGFMVDKQDCTLKGNPNINQPYIDQIRDDRLSRMLANQLQQGEQKMLFIADQQTQILVQVGLTIFQSLLSEAAQQLLYLR